MKLKMYFLMLALGVCGAAMQSCDDDDDNLKVPENCSLRFLKNILKPVRNGKPGVIITLRISRTRIMNPRPGLLSMPFG